MIEFSDIESAARRLDGVANRTPVLTSRTLNDLLGAEVLFKGELFQRGGAFKFRGAFNHISQLEQPSIVAYSSGNHGQAVALVSKLLGKDAAIVMPEDAPVAKVAAVQGYGAEVIPYDRFSQDRDQLAREVAAERGAAVVPPYDDWQVMAGAGTTAMELIEEVGDLDALVVCIGGGGLIAGCAVAATSMVPGIQVVGAEPELANDTALSLEAGQRVEIPPSATEADGLRVQTPGRLTFEVNRRLLSGVALVSEAEVANAMTFFFERMKLVVEPSGAVGLAALLNGGIESSGRRIGVVISGGNIGPARFANLVNSPWEHQHHEGALG